MSNNWLNAISDRLGAGKQIENNPISIDDNKDKKIGDNISNKKLNVTDDKDGNNENKDGMNDGGNNSDDDVVSIVSFVSNVSGTPRPFSNRRVGSFGGGNGSVSGSNRESLPTSSSDNNKTKIPRRSQSPSPLLADVPDDISCASSRGSIYLGNEIDPEDTITKLKKVNASLTEKSATMEADFLNQINALSSTITQLDKDYEDRNDQVTDLRAQIRHQKSTVRERESTVTELEGEKVEWVKEKSEHANELKDLKAQLYELQRDIEDAEFDNFRGTDRIGEAEQCITQLEKERDKMKAEVDTAYIARDVARREVVDLACEVESLRDQLGDKKGGTGGQGMEIALLTRAPSADGRLEMTSLQEETFTPGNTGVPPPPPPLPPSLSMQKQNRSFSNAPRSPSVPKNGGPVSPSTPHVVRENWQQLEVINRKLQNCENNLRESQNTLVSLKRENMLLLKSRGKDVEEQVTEIRTDSEQRFEALREMLRQRDNTIRDMDGRLEMRRNVEIDERLERVRNADTRGDDNKENNKEETNGREDIVSIEKELEQVKLEAKSLTEERNSLKLKLEDDSRDDQIKRLEETVQQLQGEKDGLMKDVEEVVGEMNNLEKDIMTSAGVRDSLKKRVEESVEECDVLKEKMDVLKKELVKSTGVKDELKKKVDDFAGERDTLKKIIEASKDDTEETVSSCKEIENKNGRDLDKDFIANEKDDYDTVDDTTTSSSDDVVISAQVMVSTTAMLESKVKEEEELNRESNSFNAAANTSSDKLLISPEVTTTTALTSKIEKGQDPKLLRLEHKQKLDETISELERITKERNDLILSLRKMKAQVNKIEKELIENSDERNSTRNKGGSERKIKEEESGENGMKEWECSKKRVEELVQEMVQLQRSIEDQAEIHKEDMNSEGVEKDKLVVKLKYQEKVITDLETCVSESDTKFRVLSRDRDKIHRKFVNEQSCSVVLSERYNDLLVESGKNVEDANMYQTKSKKEIETKVKTLQFTKERMDEGEKKYKEKIISLENELGAVNVKLNKEQSNLMVVNERYSKMTQKIVVVEEEAKIEQIKKGIHMKEKDARLVTLEREINLVQDEFMKTRNEYEKTVESKEIRIKTLQDAVTKIESVLDERVNEMEGEKMSLEITVNETKDQLEVIKTELDEARNENEEMVSLKDMQIKSLQDVVKEMEKTIVDKEEELKEENISYETSFKKIKDELEIFKEKARRIEERMVTMNMEAASKINTVEKTLTTKSKILEELQEIMKGKEEELIKIRKEFSENESSMIQRSKELEDKITNYVIKEKGYKAAILAAENEVKDITKREQEKTSKDREETSQSIQTLHTEISSITNERNHMASQLAKQLADISDSKESELREMKDNKNRTIKALEEQLQSKNKQLVALEMEHETLMLKSISAEKSLDESKMLSTEEVNSVRIERNEMETQLMKKISDFENLKKNETNVSSGVNNGRLEMFEKILQEKNDNLTVIRMEHKNLELKVVATERSFNDFKAISMKEVKIIKEQRNEFEAKVKSTSKDLEDLEASSSTELDHLRTSSAKDMQEMREDFDTRASRWEEEKRDLSIDFDRKRVELQINAENYKRVSEELHREVQNLQSTVRLLEGDLLELAQTKQKLDDTQSALVEIHDQMSNNVRDETTELVEKEKKIERLMLANSALEDKVSNLQLEIETSRRHFKLERIKFEEEISRATLEMNDHNDVIKHKNESVSRSPLEIVSSVECCLTKDHNNDLVDIYSSEVAKKAAYLDMEMRYKIEVKDLEDDNRIKMKELKVKMSDRDTTISTLVKSSVVQEKKCKLLNEEILQLEEQLKKEMVAHNHDTAVEKTQETINQLNILILDLQRKNESLSAEIKEKVLERDSAISALVKSSITQEKQISGLSEELNELRKKGSTINVETRLTGASWEEFNRLQQESEIFAGQIIEQDEELEEIRYQVEQNKIKEEQFEREISTMKSKFIKVESKESLSDMKEEVQEIEEANDKLRNEMKELRKKVRMSQISQDQMSDLEAKLLENRKELKFAIKEKEILECKLKESEGIIKEVERNKVTTSSENNSTIVQKLKEKIDELAKKEELEVQLRSEVQAAIEMKKETQRDLSKQIESLRSLRSHALEEKDTAELRFLSQIEELCKKVDTFEDIGNTLEIKEKNIKELQRDSQEQDDIIMALTTEVKKLRNTLQRTPEVDQVAGIESTVRAEIKEEIDSMKTQKQFLSEENACLQNKLDFVIKEKQEMIEELNEKVVDADSERNNFEKTMVSTFERKISLMQMNKDLTIDNLRKELTVNKEKQKEKIVELVNKTRSLKAEKEELQTELEGKIQDKTTKIQFLEQTLNAHEQVSGHMKDELDQLQSGMETVSVHRRAEVEELQEELMDIQSKVTKYEREITAHKMKLDEQKMQHEDDIFRYKEVISDLNSDTPMMRDVQSQRSDKKYAGLSEKIESLKWQVAQLQEENSKLKKKTKQIDELRSSKNDKWRNSALQEQVLILTQKLKEFDVDTESLKSSSSRKSRSNRSVVSSRSSLPRGPGSLRRTNTVSTNDVSTHTQNTF